VLCLPLACSPPVVTAGLASVRVHETYDCDADSHPTPHPAYVQPRLLVDPECEPLALFPHRRCDAVNPRAQDRG
jgi:hypothetical protein